MTKNLASVDKAGQKGRFLAALRDMGGRAYLTGGPVLGLVVVVLFAIGFTLSAIAMWISRAERRDCASTLAEI